MGSSKKTPLVSILCLSYNQKEFIKQALDSLLVQETDFLYEILINDDASTDGTKEVIQEYAKKHSNIHPVFHNENQYSKGKRNMIARYLLPKVRGRYIAICEGDDFWTDPSKLQRQVDFLEKNKDYALVFHPVRVFFDKAEKEDSVFPETNSGFTIDELLRWNFIQTNSVMYRARKSYEGTVFDAAPGDWYLHLYHAQFGKIGFINRVMSAYRRHEGGVWWGSVSGDREVFLRSVIAGHQRLNREVKKIYSRDKNLVSIAKEFIRDLTNETVTSGNYRRDVIEDLMINNPDIMSDVFSDNLRSSIETEGELRREAEFLKATITDLTNKIADMSASVAYKDRLLKEILESKSYKIGRKITAPYRLAKKAKNKHTIRHDE